MTLTVQQLQSASNPHMTVPGLRDDIPEQPRGYQYVDATFLILRKRAILAEYAGAGKKLICIMAFLKLFSLMKARNVLVVSLGTDVDQWVEEIEHFTEGVTVQRYRGTVDDRRRMRGEDVDVRVCTYQTAVQDARHLLGMHDIVILDECSFLKNPDTHAAEHLRGLLKPTKQEIAEFAHQKQFYNAAQASPTEYVWPVSATPYETSPLDIFSLFWIMQGRKSPLGDHPNRFKQMYCDVQQFRIKTPTPIKCRDGRKRHVRITVEKVKGLRPEMLNDFKSHINEHYMRHPWSVIEKELPELEVIPQWLELSKTQAKRYKEISRGDVIADYVYQERGRRIRYKQVTHALKQFYQLRCCDGLSSLPGQNKSDSVKRDRVMELLTGDLAGEKVILFSRFFAPLNDLHPLLDEEGIPWAQIDGTKTNEENTAARFALNEAKGRFVLCMTGKGGYALNLQAARYGISYNTWWNPKKIEQLHGRNRRPGGHSHVIWFHMLCKDTAEEAMWQVLREREQEFGEIFGQFETFFDALTPEEQAEVVGYGLGSS